MKQLDVNMSQPAFVWDFHGQPSTLVSFSLTKSYRVQNFPVTPTHSLLNAIALTTIAVDL